ncbi:MAG TPA: hypothetical protein PLL36_08450, partial [Candidatus Hydrogenedentes bacterium]|nr:hypothetical protein [Candidatus Hydrogenedentota bacterium]
CKFIKIRTCVQLDYISSAMSVCTILCLMISLAQFLSDLNTWSVHTTTSPLGEAVVCTGLKCEFFGFVVVPRDEAAELVAAVGAPPFFELELFGVESLSDGLCCNSRGGIEVVDEGPGAFGSSIGDPVGINLEMGVFVDETDNAFHEFLMVGASIVFTDLDAETRFQLLQGDRAKVEPVAVFRYAHRYPVVFGVLLS